MKRNICIGITVALVILIGILLWLDRKNEKETELVVAKMNEELRPLSIEKYRLEGQISNLQSEKKLLTLGTATMQFLIADLSEGTYKEIIKPMSGYNYPVALGLTVEQMPGMAGNISLKDLEQLTSKGWYLCYSFSKDEASSYHNEVDKALSLWLDAVRIKAENVGLTMENAIYFPDGTFCEEYTSVLKEHEIEVVIHTGNIGKKLMAAECEDDIWYVGSIWWRGNEILANKLSSIQHSGGEFVTIMGVDGSATNSLKDWMLQFEGEVKDMRVTDFTTMTKVQSENRKLGIAETAVLEKEIGSLMTEIEEIEFEMTKIQDKYTEELQRMRQ